jgi:hypothetical protein
MFTFSALGALVALGVAGWAVWWAIVASVAAAKAKEELRANRLEMVTLRLQAADEQSGKETALVLLDDMTTLRANDLKTMTAKLDALEEKYHTVRRLYQDSIAIDGPLASKRVQ